MKTLPLMILPDREPTTNTQPGDYLGLTLRVVPSHPIGCEECVGVVKQATFMSSRLRNEGTFRAGEPNVE